MENQEHLTILDQGELIYNKWREENPNLRPELSQADLINRNISNFNFNFTDFPGAKLEKVDFTGKICQCVS